jgi:hypothetical protein
MASVIDTVESATVEDTDTIRYVHPKHGVITLDVKTVDDRGNTVHIRGYSHELGENITVKFRPDQRVDILGS